MMPGKMKPLWHPEANAVVKDLSLACRVVDDTMPQLDRDRRGVVHFNVTEHPGALWTAERKGNQ